MNYPKPLLAAAVVALSTGLPAGQVAESQLGWIERYAKQKFIVSPEEALLNTDAEPNLDGDGFVPLYNGETLEGWTALGGTCTFEASGDVIIGTCVPGSPSTYLSTNRTDYSDFIFTAEIKWIVDGNSGIMFRARQKGDKEVTVYGPQCEMEGFSTLLRGTTQRRGWSGGIFGQSIGGWRYPLWLEAHEAARSALIEDGWNRVTIQAIGTTVKTWINGIPAAHWIDEEYSEGFFGLQIHSGQQGTVHFRNIKVKELDDSWIDLFASGDFSNWTSVKGKPIGSGWTIKDGVIYRAGIKPGDIITKEHYGDFELTFDWKISEGGNSGVKYRSRGRLGLEYQILDDGVHKDPNLSASLYALVPAAEDKPYKPAGQWNSGRILARDRLIEHWINGKKVAEIEIGSEHWDAVFKQSKYKRHEGFGTWTGPILLQDHNDEVWYRNVRIREL